MRHGPKWILAAAFVPCAALADDTVKGAEQYHLHAGSAQTAELRDAVLKADADLFDAVFIACDADRVAAMLTEDFRFVHDKGGLTPSKAQFVEDLRAGCARQASGTDFRARREAVPDSLQVWPIDNYGAVELGTHRFYARIPGKPDQLTETSDFVTLWKKVDGKWLMAESISYGHKLAQ